MNKYELIDKVVAEIAKDKGISEGEVGTYDTLLRVADIAVKNCSIPDFVAMLPTENECTKRAEEAAMLFPPEQWTDGFEQGYVCGMIAVIELIKEKLQGN